MKKILIVDDENLILFSLSMSLKSDSLEVTTASTGKSALEKIADPPQYDLYIIDLGLPDMKGTTLVKRIRKRAPHAKCIIMSGQYRNIEDLAEELVEGKEVAQCWFLSKPFDITDTEKVVARILEEQSGA